MNRQIKHILLPITIAALGSVTYAANGNTENDALAINKAPTTLSQAIAAAEKHVNGKAARAEYEHTRKGWVYEVEVVAGTKVFDVIVDPEKGTVTSSTEDKVDHEREFKHERH